MISKTKFQFKDFRLSLFLFLLFLGSIMGHFVFGLYTYNEELRNHKIAVTISASQYLTTGHFISSVSENMESEFLQMAVFVFFTMCFYQKGSAESNKPPEEKNQADVAAEAEENQYTRLQRAAHPVLWRLYEKSLTIVLTVLFLISFFFHSWGSYLMINEQNEMTGNSPIVYSEIFSQAEFWFESFQNWQSEFFSIAALGLLTIFLRQKGSPQSKKMNEPNWKTGP